jgi:hypothetical protein
MVVASTTSNPFHAIALFPSLSFPYYPLASYLSENMMLHIRKYFWGAACLLLLGCQSLDDDSAYEVSNKASFLLVQTQTGYPSIYKYANHALETDWNLKAGVSNANLSDAELVDNFIWMADMAQKSIVQVGPSSAQVQEKYTSLPLTPDYFAVGRKQILVSDAHNHKLAMIKRRNGEVQMLDFDVQNRPGRCLYNSGKFYLVQNDSIIAVYDEQAMTTRAVLSTDMFITDLMLNRYHVIVATGFDSVGYRQSLVDANGDLLIRGTSYPVVYRKARPTQYFAAQFGREYLSDLYLRPQGLGNEIVNDSNITLVPQAEDLEADFFEGNVYYLRDAHLVVRHISTRARLDSLPFPGLQIYKGMYQYAEE